MILETALVARIRHRFGTFTLDAELAVPAPGITAVFGPSGAGKSLLLRCVAGLEPLLDAEVIFNGVFWQQGRRRLATEHRRVGLVPQEASLFSHLDVRGNLEFSRRRAVASRFEFGSIVDLLALGPLLARSPRSLSGGERQRVAIARALLAEPELLLLDEPLSALDQTARNDIARRLRRLARETGLPMLLVSHLPLEVEILADHVIALRAGRCSPLRSLADLAADPSAGFHVDGGPAAVFDLIPDAEPTEPDLLRLCFDGGVLRLPWVGAIPSEPQRVRILARDVTLALAPLGLSSALNAISVLIEAETEEAGATVLYRCRSSTRQVLFARITQAARRQLGLQVGQQVTAVLKAVALLPN
jgi:molybdate transport system ATP-binding protein